jgi:hypothetical protein
MVFFNRTSLPYVRAKSKIKCLVAVKQDGAIFSAGHISPKAFPSQRPVESDVPTVSRTDAVVAALRALGLNTENLKSVLKIVDGKVFGVPGVLKPIPVELQYFQVPSGALKLVYQMNIKTQSSWVGFYSILTF